MTSSTSHPPAEAALASPTPRRLRSPSWLDLRLIVGVVLVLASIVVGAKVVASADDRVGVWQATRDLAPGAVLGADDLRIARVRLPSIDAYIPADDQIVGQTVARQVQAGELVPRSGIGEAESGVTVTLPVAVDDVPGIRRGERIIVWVTSPSCRTARVLAGVVVQDVVAPRSGALSGSSRVGITVQVSADAADRVVAAIAERDAVIRVGVLSGPQSGSSPSGAAELIDEGCGAP